MRWRIKVVTYSPSFSKPGNRLENNTGFTHELTGWANKVLRFPTASDQKWFKIQC